MKRERQYGSAVRETPLESTRPTDQALTISQWPSNDRPRERLRDHGATALSDAELIAIVLGSGTPGRDAVATARALIAEAGSLGRLLAAPDDLPRVSGVGPVKRARLCATLELARRALHEKLVERPSITGPHDSAAFLQAHLQHLTHEVFACVFLDARLHVLGFEQLFRGTIDAAHVYPREVVRACVKYHAHSVIFAHNHPSGSRVPSQSDQDLTTLLVNALRMIDIRVLDHLIIGEGEPVSMSELGMLWSPGS